MINEQIFKMFSQEDIDKINNASLKNMVEVKQVVNLDEALTILGRLSLRWVTVGGFRLCKGAIDGALSGASKHLSFCINVNLG